MFKSQANKQKTNKYKQTTKHKRRNDVASIEINTKHENKPVNQPINRQTNKRLTTTCLLLCCQLCTYNTIQYYLLFSPECVSLTKFKSIYPYLLTLIKITC